MKTGIDLIEEERRRQIFQEEWTPEHDDGHRSGELNDAAIGYAQAAAYQARGESIEMIRSAVPAGVIRWPWEDSWWKPSESPIRNLVKAGALVAAEIDRLQRTGLYCPNCGSSEISKGHVGPESYVGETDFKTCDECNHQWDHQ